MGTRWLWLHVWCQIRKSLSAQLRSSSELLLSNNHKLPQSVGTSSPRLWLVDTRLWRLLIGQMCHRWPPGHRLGDLKAIRDRALRWAMACTGNKKLITGIHNLYRHISHFYEQGKCKLNFHLYLSVRANKMVLVFYSAFSHPGPNQLFYLAETT